MTTSTSTLDAPATQPAKKAPYVGTSENTLNTLALLDAARISGAATLLLGKPGVGKTALIKALAEKYNIPLKILIGSIMDPVEFSGLPVLTQDENGNTVAKNTCPDWAQDLINANGGILFLDELTTSTPTVQAAMLSLLQGRMVGQYKLPDSVWIIAAGNAAEDASDGWELTAPLANRLMHINYIPDNEDWFRGMHQKWGQDDVSAYERELRGLFVAFLRQTPKLINAMPDDTSQAGGAWPSYRSWDNCASTIAQIPVDKDTVRKIAMRGFVGETAAQQFTQWHRELKLPAYKDVLNAPEKLNWKGLTTDACYAIISIVFDNITEENLAQSAEVFKVAADNGARNDILLAFSHPMISKIQTFDTQKARPILLGLFKKFGKDWKAAGIQ